MSDCRENRFRDFLTAKGAKRDKLYWGRLSWLPLVFFVKNSTDYTIGQGRKT
jgi:hypothetical protein